MVGLISVEGAQWLQKCLCMYAEKISREGMVRMFSIGSDMWLMLFLKTVWDINGVHIELTTLVGSKNQRAGVLEFPVEEDRRGWVFLAYGDRKYLVFERSNT